MAARLGWLYFDTGALYRALTWLAVQAHIDTLDAAGLAALARRTPISVRPPTQADGRLYTVEAEGRDITWDLRRPEVDAAVSRVSEHPQVRAALIEQQRRVAAAGPVVVVGRDIGTVVMPDAPLKIYLDASPEERARRRTQEKHERGAEVDYQVILADMRRRDKHDGGRAVAPMRPAADAVKIDTTGMSIEQVIDAAVRLAAERGLTDM